MYWGILCWSTRGRSCSRLKPPCPHKTRPRPGVTPRCSRESPCFLPPTPPTTSAEPQFLWTEDSCAGNAETVLSISLCPVRMIIRTAPDHSRMHMGMTGGYIMCKNLTVRELISAIRLGHKLPTVPIIQRLSLSVPAAWTAHLMFYGSGNRRTQVLSAGTGLSPVRSGYIPPRLPQYRSPQIQHP